jgi:hypothetical protein
MGTLKTITATDAPFGAIGDGTVHLFDPSKSPADPAWHGQYAAGVDTLDYIGLQEAIYAAFGAPGKENSVQGASRNVPLYIPPGRYLINKPLQITRLFGGRLIGGGRLSTTIVQLTPATSVLTTNGISFSRVEGIAFHAGAKTNFRGRWRMATAYAVGATVCAPDGGIWKATVAGTSGASEPTWGGSVHDGPIVWERVAPFALVTVDWDAKWAGGWTGACQSNTFADCHFSGENTGVDFGVAIAPTGGNSMGSENLFANCFWQWFTTAGFVTMGFNALQNTIIGGNFEGCTRYGVWFFKGAGAVYSTGFQNGFVPQIEIGGYDIAFTNSTDDASVVTGCRTESGQFVSVANDHKVSVRGCAIVPPMAVWRAGTKYPAGSAVVGSSNTDGIAYFTVAGGTAGTTEPVWDVSKAPLSDGTVTWKALNYSAVAGANIALDDCVVLYGQVALRSNDQGNGHVHGCSFSRPDWLQQVGNGQWTIMNNIVNLAGGPNNSHGTARYSIDDGVQGNTPAHRSVLGLGRDAAILFTAAEVPSVGITRGDARRDILGVHGAIGRPTPVSADLATTPANADGSDLTLIGGLSAGTGAPGRIVLQTADAGPGGAVVNEPATRLTVSAAGVTVGAGAPRIRKLVATTVGWRPGRIASGGTVSLAASLYGVMTGDVVGVGFSAALPAGCLLQAVVTGAGRVRVELFNLSGGAVSIDAGRLRLEAWLHGDVGVASGAADDVAQLVTELGDVAAIYDARVGVVAKDSAVSRWNDARGADGYGPALASTGTGAAPYYNPVAGTIVGGAMRLQSAPSGTFDLSHPTVVVLVGAVGRVWTAESVVAVGIGNGSRSVTVDTDRRGVIGASIDGRTQVSAPVAASAETRLVTLTVPTASTFALEVVGGAAIGQHIATAFPGGAYALTVGPSLVRAVLVLRGSLEAERRARLSQWASAVHGAESVG